QQLLQHCGFTFFGITWHDMLPCRPDSEKSGEIAYWTTRLTEGDLKNVIPFNFINLVGDIPKVRHVHTRGQVLRFAPPCHFVVMTAVYSRPK
ncbi:hypothetical protein, partial [Marinobacter halodurans]|uniref:hypothetical protein n=1 Tax=Marinobacter halodurans TaxID=2528979 RepID=UPI001A955CDD